MTDRGASSLLPEPAQPSWWKQCPHCEQAGTLKRERTVSDPVAGRVAIYRCQFCLEEVEFAEAHPPGAV